MWNKSLWSSKRTDWSTPMYIFDELDREFNFTLDACADENNHKCDVYYSKKEDALKQEWTGSVFMNPPYGRGIYKWVKKAYEESLKGATVVCLLPARTDTRWFHDFCLKGEIRFYRGRIYFDDDIAKRDPKKRAPFPSMLVIFHGK